MADASTVDNAARGVDQSGWPYPWRFVFTRHLRNFGDVVNDPARGPWNRTQPDGTMHPGHTDAYEQIVGIGEQVSWRHTFSDGITRDTADVLMELMEFVIDQRTATKRPTSSFAGQKSDETQLERLKKAI